MSNFQQKNEISYANFDSKNLKITYFPENQSHANFDFLPPELIHKIGNYLNVYDWKNYILTCKRINNVFNEYDHAARKKEYNSITKFVKSFGYSLIKEVSIDFNGHKIDSYNSDWINIWNEFEI